MGKLTTYTTGATRDSREGKLVFDKFLSHSVILQFAKYMNMNRVQSDGKLRSGDNWQKGITQEDYMESAFRHFMDFWDHHRNLKNRDRDGHIEGIGAVCGLLFNIMGWLHEWLKENEMVDFDLSEPTFEMSERLMATENARIEAEGPETECKKKDGRCNCWEHYNIRLWNKVRGIS
ncbi:MAG: hypothetical protein ACYTE8_01045 [Planctomycetota bacterium]|jgi:hypothetical protein